MTFLHGIQDAWPLTLCLNFDLIQDEWCVPGGSPKLCLTVSRTTLQVSVGIGELLWAWCSYLQECMGHHWQRSIRLQRTCAVEFHLTFDHIWNSTWTLVRSFSHPKYILTRTTWRVFNHIDWVIPTCSSWNLALKAGIGGHTILFPARRDVAMPLATTPCPTLLLTQYISPTDDVRCDEMKLQVSWHVHASHHWLLKG